MKTRVMYCTWMQDGWTMTVFGRLLCCWWDTHTHTHTWASADSVCCSTQKSTCRSSKYLLQSKQGDKIKQFCPHQCCHAAEPRGWADKFTLWETLWEALAVEPGKRWDLTRCSACGNSSSRKKRLCRWCGNHGNHSALQAASICPQRLIQMQKQPWRLSWPLRL